MPLKPGRGFFCVATQTLGTGGVTARRNKSKEQVGCRRYKGERRENLGEAEGRAIFVELRWGRRASNFTYFKDTYFKEESR